jgi:hypothetical protein
VRATKTVTITAEGRDKGRTFLLTEMPASQAEEWATRALSAMARSGVDIPPEYVSQGWGAIAFIGIRSLLAADFEDVKPLLAEMMSCVQSVQPAITRPLVETDIEEVATRIYLRDEVFRLHANFSLVERLLTLAASAQPETGQNDGSPNTSTSPNP